MKRGLFFSVLILGISLIVVYGAHAGVCFRWNDIGESACSENMTQEECDALASLWDHIHFLEGESANCEGELENLPAQYETDVDDLDGDGDVTETIRWRYVVVIDTCWREDYDCDERHQLVRCWNDDDHN